jgi:hypothetical protein
MPSMDEIRAIEQVYPKTIARIKEIKGLMNKFPQYDGIIRLAVFNSINGDNQLLDQMLEQLHGIDSLANVKF